ncbi:hypothetical protein EJ05DRAFT_531238 [Pseudovirgaria hyperparasitica]|uniref:ABC transporter domain-containing protein n=1 Tax=Pseudovirgaria hyperparasitica TaxID=470096 RepID=A0A6A6WF50_9PEZI|nr:uncharacterized protein EJ05DRAFT_531238 [Pseudovirgaria hyperparasitica]KAF2759741.1 hypothetical protein EJ05DRAFT_531238 [Pseudovirgaria hyperparasitica]
MTEKLQEDIELYARYRGRFHRDEACHVGFRDLTVNGRNYNSDYQRTCGNYPFSILQQLLYRRPSIIPILRQFDGLIEPGETVLVLGRPGSGCSTFLKTLSGQHDGLTITSDSKIRYNGLENQERHGELVYHAETDHHFPELTVHDTLKYAASAKVPLYDSANSCRSERLQSVTDCILKLFSLESSARTRVGDDLIRGVSGGERQRISISEAYVCNGKVHCWDQSTRGLDSATALNIVKLIKESSRSFGTVSLMSLYQASQDMYETFDKVCLLYEGRQIYFGAASEAKEYFTSLGFVCEERMTTADFLTSLTNPEEHVVTEGFHKKVPRSAEDFEVIWKASTKRKELIAQIEKMVSVEVRGEMESQDQDAHLVQKKSSYVLPFHYQVALCNARALQRMKSNMAVPVSGILAQGVLGILTGSMFYNLHSDTASFYSRGALVFFASLLNATASGFEVGTIWAQRPIVEKHHRYALYHPCTEAIAAMICDIPAKILSSLLLNFAVYFMSNLRRTPGAFFTYLVFAFSLHLTMSMFYRMVGYLSRTLAHSMAPVSVWILNWIISTGFIVPTREMRPWVRWIGYINPIAYAFESMMLNEFDGQRFPCTTIIPKGPPYDSMEERMMTCSTVGSIPGETYVEGNRYVSESFGFERSHLWRNLGILWAFLIVFMIVLILGAEFASAEKPRGDILIFRRPSSSKSPITTGHKTVAKEAPARLSGMANIQSHNSVLHWNDLCYDIKSGSAMKRILDQVEGWVRPGQLTVLMGATGAGKTTLLDVLANRTRLGVISGNIAVDGRPRLPAFQRQTGYVQQTDIHIPELTVRESLMFSASLRQPADIMAEDKAAYVEQVMETLEMKSYADAVVGIPGNGLNIEQRRRLSIATELAAKPALLLFLDEPTSGLDSETAWLICRLLRKLADGGQAILCTIHQPSSHIFNTFDRLLLLDRGGRSIYFGDIGHHGAIMKNYFTSHGARDFTEHENPAEWLLEMGSSSKSDDTIDWVSVWRNSQQRRDVQEQITKLSERQSPAVSIYDSSEFAVRFPTQLYTVLLRALQQDWRVPSYLYSKVLLSFGMAFSIGVSFWAAPSTIQGTQGQVFAVFLLLTLFSNMMQLLIWRFAYSRAIFEARERPSKIFSWKTFMCSTMIAEVPSQTFIAVVVYVCFYYPVGMYRHMGSAVRERSGLMFMLIWAYLMFTSSFAHMMAIMIPEPATAINISQLLYMLCLLFCGVLVPSNSFPRFWIFMYRVTPITYLVEGLSTTGLGRRAIECARQEVLVLQGPTNVTCEIYLGPYVSANGGRILNPDSMGSCRFCPVADTDSFLGVLTMSYSRRWLDLGLMFVYIAFNVSAALGVYWLINRRQRR